MQQCWLLLQLSVLVFRPEMEREMRGLCADACGAGAVARCSCCGSERRAGRLQRAAWWPLDALGEDAPLPLQGALCRSVLPLMLFESIGGLTVSPSLQLQVTAGDIRCR